MKIFCTYAFTGQDFVEVESRMKLVVKALESAGHEPYCNLFDPAVRKLQTKDDTKAIFKEAFRRLEEHEGVVAIVVSPEKSIGQIIEIGVALSQNKPVYLLEHASAQGTSYLPELATKTYSWSDEEELRQQLQEFSA